MGTGVRRLVPQQESWAASGKVDEPVCSVLTPDDREDIQAGHAAHVDGTQFVILTHRLKQYRIPANASYDLLHRFIDQLLAN
jgi:hypothetical protein